MAAEYRRVAALTDIPETGLLSVELEDFKVCLARADGTVYAFRDNCSHKDFPLSAGELDDGQIECAWHGARFELATGRALRLPAIRPVATYPVKIEDGEILIAV